MTEQNSYEEVTEQINRTFPPEQEKTEIFHEAVALPPAEGRDLRQCYISQVANKSAQLKNACFGS